MNKLPFFAFILILLSITACQKNYETLVPDGKPGGGVLRSALISVNQDTLIFETDVFIVNSIGNFISDIEKNNFFITLNTDALSSIEAFEIYTCDSIKGAYSANLLIDQSGSISDTDPENARIEGGIAFINAMSKDDEISLSYFQNSTIDILSDFTQKKSELRKNIEELAGTEGGGTPLYAASVDMINYVSQQASNENKALVVFTDGEDTGGSSKTAVINAAVNANISIYPVGLQEVDTDDLLDIALGTGGAFLFADDAIQLVSLCSSLDDILNGSSLYYTIRWKALKNSENWNNSGTLSGTIRTTLGEGSLVNIPIRVNL